MPQEWSVLTGVANGLTVAAVLVIVLYILISGKLVTRVHLDDVTKTLEGRCEDIGKERDREVERADEARRELAENNEVLRRLESTVRESLQALQRRR